MIIKGFDALSEVLHKIHTENRAAYYKRVGPSGANNVSDYDDDYVVDALFDVPNR